MVKKKGDLNHSTETKQLMISLINDYKLFNASDAHMMRLLSQKLGKNISYGLFAELKKESNKRNTIASEWLDTYCRGKIIDHYWTRIKELEFVQRTLLEEFSNEASKQEKKNRFLINALARTISENTQRLSEMGMSPPVIAKLYSMIPKEILEGNMDPIHLQKYLKDFDEEKNEDSNIKAIPKLVDSNTVSNKDEPRSNDDDDEHGDNNEIDPLSAETAIPPPIDKKNDTGSDGGSSNETATAQGDQPVF